MRPRPAALQGAANASAAVSTILAPGAGATSDFAPAFDCSVPGAGHGSIEIDGLQRAWSWYVPSTAGSATAPVWIQFHGVRAQAATEIGRLQEASERHGFIVVAPQSRFDDPPWMWEPQDERIDTSRANPDIAFAAAILDQLDRQGCVDPSRIYAGGFSAGGEAAVLLSCALPERIAAAATVSGLSDLAAICERSGSLPLLAVHGTDDPILRYEGGVGELIADDVMANGQPFGQLPIVREHWRRSIPERAASFAEASASPSTLEQSAPVEGVERWRWRGGATADVDLYVIEGAGHAWPAGAPLDATELIWEFFERHPMPE